MQVLWSTLFDRSIVRSLDRSIARSLERSIARLLLARIIMHACTMLIVHAFRFDDFLDKNGLPGFDIYLVAQFLASTWLPVSLWPVVAQFSASEQIRKMRVDKINFIWLCAVRPDRTICYLLVEGYCLSNLYCLLTCLSWGPTCNATHAD